MSDIYETFFRFSPTIIKPEHEKNEVEQQEKVCNDFIILISSKFLSDIT